MSRRSTSKLKNSTLWVKTEPLRMPLRKQLRKVQVARMVYFDRFVFVHINKTGGSSIEKALKLPLNHQTAVERREWFGHEAWERRFTFSIVRNPWDRMVSLYHYRVLTNQTGLGGQNRISFHEWIIEVCLKNNPEFVDQPRMFMPQWDWLVDSSERLLVDYVGRFEKFSETIAELETLMKRRIRVYHIKTSERKSHYQDYYNAQTRQIVANRFHRDIEQFDYTF